MGHTHHGRPGVLALRPAPLQLHRLGYPGSLGAERLQVAGVEGALSGYGLRARPLRMPGAAAG